MASDPSESRSAANAPPMPPAAESSGIGMKIMIGVVVLAVFGGIGFGVSQLTGSSKNDAAATLTHVVSKGEMVITVTEDGNVESASNVEVKCRVSGGSSILAIVEDGKYVKQGDDLVTLDSSGLEDQINAQIIKFNNAKSGQVEAATAVSVAKISVKEYLEGTFKQENQTADANITIAMENLRSAQNSLEHTKKMFRKGFVSVLELESQQFGVKNAQLSLDSMKTAKDVLVRFTKAKMLEDLKSKQVQAEAKLESANAQYKLEQSTLTDLKEQLKHCKIIAPQDGMVVYANVRSRWGQQSSQIEEGANVRERQAIIRLPDLNKMQVKVTVHETKVEKLSVGMPARIRIQGKELQGTVVSIGNQPEPGSWFSGSVKEYATIVKINDSSMDGLKPGMTAEVEILVAHKTNAVTLPVAAVVANNNRFAAWVKKGSSFEKRDLTLGMTDDKYVEVVAGVDEGDTVILNPKAVSEEAKAFGNEGSGKKVDVAKKFGKGGAAAANKASQAKTAAKQAAKKGGKKKGGKKGGRRRITPWSELVKGDKDGDKKLTKKELPERYGRFFQFIDSDKDGKLTKKEYEAMLKRMRSRGSGGGRRGGGGGRRGGGGGRRGGGQ